jgi:hypothetical protein
MNRTDRGTGAQRTGRRTGINRTRRISDSVRPVPDTAVADPANRRKEGPE